LADPDFHRPAPTLSSFFIPSPRALPVREYVSALADSWWCPCVGQGDSSGELNLPYRGRHRDATSSPGCCSGRRTSHLPGQSLHSRDTRKGLEINDCPCLGYGTVDVEGVLLRRPCHGRSEWTQGDSHNATYPWRVCQCRHSGSAARPISDRCSAAVKADMSTPGGAQTIDNRPNYMPALYRVQSGGWDAPKPMYPCSPRECAVTTPPGGRFEQWRCSG
jgi:hypothetical protein